MIVFNNWTLTVTGLIARQYDNLSRRIDVEGDLPAGYTWQLLVQSGGNADTILLEATETGAGSVLTADNLSKAGEYYIQLRGVLEADGVTKRHTNVVSAYIPESLTGLGTWPEVPTEFAQIEQRCAASMIAAESAADAAKADADRATALAAEVSKKAAQTAKDAVQSAQAKEAAQTAQRLAEEAQGAAEAARTAAAAAQAAAETAATDAAGAKQGAETAQKAAQDAAAAAANTLGSIQTLYQEMQTWAQDVIQDVNAAGSAAVQSVQSAGDAQVQRVTDEGTTQTANAKAQADAAAQSASGAAQSAQQAAESAAVYDTVVADVNQLKQEIGQHNIVALTKYNAVISSSNVWNTNSNGATQCIAVPVNGGEALTITHRSGITFHLAFLKSWSTPVNGETPDFCDGYANRIVIPSSGVTTIRTIPSDCKYVYVLTLNNNVDYSPLEFVVDWHDWTKDIYNSLLSYADYKDNQLQSQVDVVNNIIDNQKKINDFALIDGYVNYRTGGISAYSGDGNYKRTDYIPITGASKIESNFTSNADAGYAFYTPEKIYISGGTLYPASVPSNAAFVILSNHSISATHTGLYATIIYRSLISKTIACYGDSVTEGMGMADIGTAVYGGDCYPSHLLTMLTDANINAKVFNYGHSGERSTETCARVGGRVCGYLGEDVTIPSNNAAQSLGVAVVADYKVTGSKLYSTGKNADGTTAQLLFTKLGHDTRPLMVGDRPCNIYQAQQDGGMLQTINLANPTGEETTLPALSVITTGNSKRNADVAVVYMGVNDGTNLTLDEWIGRCNSIIERNPKTLILGATNHNWTFWAGMTGTDAEKRATYLNACLANFGSYYLDLYDILTTKKGIDIAITGGYLSDRTAEQITADNNAIANRRTPPSLTLEGTAGEVHLNTIGYYVLAKVVYDKINQLGLL